MSSSWGHSVWNNFQDHSIKLMCVKWMESFVFSKSIEHDTTTIMQLSPWSLQIESDRLSKFNQKWNRKEDQEMSIKLIDFCLSIQFKFFRAVLELSSAEVDFHSFSPVVIATCSSFGHREFITRYQHFDCHLEILIWWLRYGDIIWFSSDHIHDPKRSDTDDHVRSIKRVILEDSRYRIGHESDKLEDVNFDFMTLKIIS